MELMKNRKFAVYNDSHDTGELSTLCRNLMEVQKPVWKQLQDNYASLGQSEYRDLAKDGFSFRIQFNPGRIVSAKAKVDPKSIVQRKCFLCLENLPDPQLCIVYRDEYLILCNPWPIFSGHFTISHIQHRPQAIEDSLISMLKAVKDLSPEYILFYNGPKCGASAPDHLHFQAAPKGSMPIEKDVAGHDSRQLICINGDVSLYKATSAVRSVLIIEGKTIEGIQEAFVTFLRGMQQLISDPSEPMINVICAFQDDLWTVIIFPRQKFRPSVYFLEGEDQILISPGAVEMGGFIVTPRKRDFDKLNMEIIDEIYGEVSLNDNVFEKLINHMK
jgi:hypothetical protein